LFGPGIDQEASTYDGNDAQNGRHWQTVVFSSVDLDCPQIHGLLLARVRESPVNKSYNAGDNQQYSCDLHSYTRSFILDMATLPIIGWNMGLM
jgi:hypothetical protein